jgi:hypothetical protein
MSSKRVWELFSDPCYYDMWCVRLVSDKNFNSVTSFHLARHEDAKKLLELLELAL